MTKPVISYISALYNKADVVLQTLTCLRNQTDIDPEAVELIFCDDASSDGSVEVLQAEARKDHRIKLITNDRNVGPSIRLNQAAEMAQGSYILPIDADDLLPQNATAILMNCIKKYNVPLVFGETKRGLNCTNISATAKVLKADDALAFCAKRQIVHMGFLVEKEIWRAASGANEKVFIQDQSLPLRLSMEASKLAYIEDTVYWLRPANGDNLSRNKIQQHHDRFFSLLPLLGNEKASAAAHDAMMRQIISTLWKLRRDGGKPLPHMSWAFIRYMLNRSLSYTLSDQSLVGMSEKLRQLPEIRRPDSEA